jgi:hypothetical protein
MRLPECINEKFVEMKYSLYSLKDYLPRPSKRDIVSGITGLSLLAMSACTSTAPVKTPVTPPVTQQNSGTYQNVTENETGKESNITVYPKGSLREYAQGKGIDAYFPQLVGLEENGILTDYGKAYVDLVVNNPKAGELVPGIYGKLLKLPDLSMEKYSKIDEKDIKAVEKILALASDPKYTAAFLSMDSVGIKDKRKYNAAYEALLWEAFDDKTLSNFLEPYSLEKLIENAWKNTSTSRNYSKKRWEDYNEVIARLNFPEGSYWYVKDNMQFSEDMFLWYEPKELFDRKVGDCTDYSTFIIHCLLEGGYTLYNKSDTNQTDSVCTLLAVRISEMGSIDYGHAVPIVKNNNQIYSFDATPLEIVDRGPFKSIEDLLNTKIGGWTVALILDDQPYNAIGIVESEYFKKRMKDKTYSNMIKNLIKEYPWKSDWLKEYIDNYSK